jgi:hypothetical protein
MQTRIICIRHTYIHTYIWNEECRYMCAGAAVCLPWCTDDIPWYAHAFASVYVLDMPNLYRSIVLVNVVQKIKACQTPPHVQIYRQASYEIHESMSSGDFVYQLNRAATMHMGHRRPMIWMLICTCVVLICLLRYTCVILVYNWMHVYAKHVCGTNVRGRKAMMMYVYELVRTRITIYNARIWMHTGTLLFDHFMKQAWPRSLQPM